jgi:DNA-binding response OmpR family regulator
LIIDRELWMRVVLNVVSNAVKYTETGSISVDLAYSKGDVVLTVTDTGVGIAEDDLPHIFERFHQSTTRPVRGDAGSGIGLALVAELLRAVGGSATVESGRGRGTVATLRHPADPAAEASSQRSSTTDRLLASGRAEIETITGPAESDDTENQPADDDAGRGRVLIVEDNRDLRKYLSRLLRSAGWQVTATDTAEAAQAVIVGHDVVISDIMLPGLSGVDLVRWIRAHAEVQWTPVLLLTARAGTDSVVEGLTAGADDFVTKPFDPEELLARVATHMELSLLRKVVLDEAEDRAENLQRALSSNRLIGTALGIVMATRKVTADQAFALLREESQTSNRKLREVADDVVFTGALPQRAVGRAALQEA